jgi:hypothetical protein
MATLSHRQPAGTTRRPSSLAALPARDALATWLVPAVAGAVLLGAAALGATALLALPVALGVTIGAALVLLLFIGLRPLLAPDQPVRARGLGAALALVWLAACYAPFHARLFPGPPLVAGAQLGATGEGVPLRIPAAGLRTVDLMLEGRLAPNPTGGPAAPVGFVLTIEDAAGTAHTVAGQFEDELKNRRLGRRGSAVVHQLHTATRRVLPNPGGGDLTVTRVTLEPATAQPISLSAFAYRLPGPLVLALAGAALLAAIVAFDRLGPAPETDGALTLATAAALGTAIIFWTSDAIHPGFQTLIGAAIFGGALGFGAGALVWWVAKRVIARPA